MEIIFGLSVLYFAITVITNMIYNTLHPPEVEEKLNSGLVYKEKPVSRDGPYRGTSATMQQLIQEKEELFEEKKKLEKKTEELEKELKTLAKLKADELQESFKKSLSSSYDDDAFFFPKLDDHFDTLNQTMSEAYEDFRKESKSRRKINNWTITKTTTTYRPKVKPKK